MRKIKKSILMINRVKKCPVEILLIMTIFSNITLHTGNVGRAYSPTETFCPTMLIERSSQVFHGFRREERGIPFVTSSSGLGDEWFISFKGLFSIFDLTSWIVLFTLTIITGIIFVIIMRKVSQSLFQASWCGMFSVVILLEHGFDTPKCIHQTKYLALLRSCWILVGIVIANAYRGSNIDQFIVN